MDTKWTKQLYRVLTPELLKDHLCLAIIVWLFSKADKEGNVVITRSQGAAELGIKPTTFYKALCRVTTKYQRSNIVSNNEATLIQLDMEPLDGTGKVSGNSPGNNKVTTKYQPKGVSSSSPVSLSPITPITLSTPTSSRNNTTPAREGKFKTLDSLAEIDLEHIASDYRVNVSLVKYSYERMKNYCLSHGKIYKDHKHALRNFVLSEMKSTMERRQDGKHGIDASRL